MNASPVKDNALLGAALIAMAVFMIAANNALGKFFTETLHPVEVAFYRNAIVLTGLLAWLHCSKQWHLTRTADLKGQLHRAFVGTMGVVCTFWAISKLPLADATTLFYTAPLSVILLSYPLLGEKVGPWRIGAVLAGFGGILVVANPSGSTLPWDGLAIALGAAVFHALTQLQLRKLGRKENPMTTVFYFMLLGTLMTGLAMPLAFTAPPAMDSAPLLALFALSAISQQVLKTYGYSMAPTALVTPMNYTGLVWAVILGLVVWGEVPGASVYLGGAVIISANLFILWREYRAKKITRA